MNPSFLKKSSVVSVSVLLVLTASICIDFFSNDNDTTQLLALNGHKTNTSATETNKTGKTIATAWKWENSLTTSLEKPLEMHSDTHNTIEDQSSPAFSEKAVYNALHRVRLDNQNNVIIDHETLIALNETLGDSRLQLDDQALSELQIIIRLGLPGDVGDEVSRIVGNYYQFLDASKEFNAVYGTTPSTAQGIENTTEEHEDIYHELMALRELYLGTDVANKLFSTSNANANYMFDMHKIEQDTHFSDEEKQQKRVEITERHAEQTIDIRNWNERQQAFLVAKQNILMASINDQEKQPQLTELMHQHFSGKELAHVRHLQLDKP
jgi:hypothetical protein